MLVTLLAWIYITLVCLAWGILALRQLKTWFKDEAFVLPSFPIICATGLAVVTVLAGILSLWMPLGDWPAQLIIVCPCLLIIFKKWLPGVIADVKKQFTGWHLPTLILLACSLVMVLVMSTWTINHPDTLAYHAQTIHWIEQYKIVPGLVNLYTRYGYQGQWFVSCAFFSFRFTGTEALTFLNSTVLAWYLFFIIRKINNCLSVSGERMNAFLWLLLFAASCLSYTQLRLTASSASPDFIATLFIWLVFYLLLQATTAASTVHWIWLIFLSVFPVTLKLSALPVLLAAIYPVVQLARSGKIKAILVSVILAIVVLVPFFSRNIISTGYLAFPSTFPDIIQADWKYDKGSAAFERDYITAYARMPVNYAKEDVEKVMTMGLRQWIPGWWRNMQAADKAIILFLLLALLVFVARLRSLFQSSPVARVSLLVTLAGIIFWFVAAPDPRFGFGFILSFIAIVFALFFTKSSMVNHVPLNFIKGALVMASLVIASYTGYRFVQFFSSRQLIQPLGVVKNTAVSFECGNTRVTRPATGEYCGDLPLPCVYSDSCNFILRGEKITDGFKQR